MSTTQHKFEVGQRVEMTECAIQQGLHGRIVNRRTGVIKALDERVEGTTFLVVRRDGDKGNGHYHPDFWQPASTEAIADDGRYCRTCGQRLP